MQNIYLDNSATTMCSEEVIRIMNKVYSSDFGNPSSLHKMGIIADEHIKNSKSIIADSIGAKPTEIFFTSGGTQSNNILVLGAALSLKQYGNKVITTNIEHPSVLNCYKHLEKLGFDVVYVCPEDFNEEYLSSIIDGNTILVSMMLVNNELGNILPVEIIKNIISVKCPHALVHCDAVQAYGKVKFSVGSLGVDLLSASSHKIHGPKGCGFCYIKSGNNLKPINFGGGQESGFFNGTQNVPAIVGFAKASEIAFADIDENYKYVLSLKERLTSELNKINNIRINSSENSVPYIVNFSVLGCKSEVLLNFLSSKGIYVSAGSACSKGHKSYVLENYGFDNSIIDSALRVSFSKYNTFDDIDYLIGYINEAINLLK